MARKIQFGLFQPQVGLPFSALKERALAGEEYGFHSIWWKRTFLISLLWTLGQPAKP